MEIELLDEGRVVSRSEWPCTVSDDEPLADPAIQAAIDKPGVGESVDLGDGFSVRRVS
jgi:hypothetical protein